MRIISGKYKSRRLFIPKTGTKMAAKSTLRPTSDRARETLFDVLNNYIDFTSLQCLDLFAGTGAFGFEVLSRGAASCCFVDVSKEALDSIGKTAAELGCEKDIELVHTNVLRYFSVNKPEYFDMIFADPPYSYENYRLLAQNVLTLKPQIFVLEASGGLEEVFEAENYNIFEKKSGSAKFIFFILK